MQLETGEVNKQIQFFYLVHEIKLKLHKNSVKKYSCKIFDSSHCIETNEFCNTLFVSNFCILMSHAAVLDLRKIINWSSRTS